MANKNLKKTKIFLRGSSHVLPRNLNWNVWHLNWDVLRDLPSALNTLFLREEFNPGGRFELPEVRGVPGGRLDEQCVNDIMATVFQNWDNPQLHIMLRGSNDIRSAQDNLVLLRRIEQLCLFFKECRDKGAKAHLIICTPVPSPKTPNLEPMFRDTDDIIGLLLKFDDFKDSAKGIQPSYLNLSSLVPFRDGDGKVETEIDKGSLFQPDLIHLNVVGTAKGCTKLQIR